MADFDDLEELAARDAEDFRMLRRMQENDRTTQICRTADSLGLIHLPGCKCVACEATAKAIRKRQGTT